MRGSSLGAAGEQTCAPLWARGRPLTSVSRWELGKGMSTELWLFMLLREDAVSMLEVELCGCPRPVLLQGSSLSAWEAALVMWGAVPGPV